MTLPLRRKHQTTRRNFRPWKNTNLVGTVIAAIQRIAGPCDSLNRDYGDYAQTIPSRLAIALAFSIIGTSISHAEFSNDLSRESALMAAAWEEDDALASELASEPADLSASEPTLPIGESRSVLTKRPEGYPLHTVDPFEADDRLAQLPNDPFDEPSGDTIPELDPQQRLDEIENALEREMDRREAEVRERAGQAEETENRGDVTDTTEANERSQIGQPAPQDTFDFQLQTPPRSQEDTFRPFQRSEARISDEAAQSQQSCEEELAALRADRISTVDLSIRIDGVPGEDFPYECPIGNTTLQPRVWPEITYNWKASALCHKPLYFEDVQLERYGHTWLPDVQPLVSGAHFFGSVAILPYKMGLQTPNECVYALGHYRPGSCAPYYIEALPFTWRAAAFQTGVITGIHFALP
jgi:hypothetical protein